MPNLTRPQALLFGVALTAGFVIALFPIFPGQLRVQEGDVASRTIRAPRDLSFESSLLTQQARDAAENAVPGVQTFDPSVRTEQLALLAAMTGQVSNIRNDEGASIADKRARILAIEGLGDLPRASVDTILGLTDSQWLRVAQEANAVVEQLLSESIAAATLAETRSGVESDVSLDLTANLAALTADLVRPHVQATLIVDSDATAQARAEARGNVEPVRQTVARNQVVVSEGSRIDATAAEVLEHAGLSGPVLEWERLGSVVVISTIAALALASYALLFPVRSLNSDRRLVLLAVFAAAPVLIAKVYLSLVLPDEGGRFLMYFLPVAAAPMLVAALLDARLAMLMALVQGALIAFAAAYLPEHAFFTSLQPIDIAGLFLVYGVGAVLGALAAYRAERPNQYVLAGVLLAAGTFALLFALWLLGREKEPVDVFWMATAAALSGLGAGLLTAGGLAAMGSILGVTTRFQLMELAQLNSPLLRRLQDEAPGTFHHSVIVANLAERAADLIGADALLVRVGCYHHDIGKVLQPGYYVENQLGGDNPHDDLEPEASARIIRQHVSNGLDLAQRHGLPARVQAFIPQHHGTRLVPYFYRQAVEKGLAVNDAAFRYPGPRPQTRETAIVMLADSAEAMVRASPDRSPERISAVVEEVIAERLAEGELEECDLTLRDLRTIAASFKQTLSGVYHPRIEYPEPTPQERRMRVPFRPGWRAGGRAVAPGAPAMPPARPQDVGEGPAADRT